MAPSILQRAAELAREDRPFVVATVVWRRGPTSGQEGAKALVLSDGSLEGWLAGSCARAAVVREGLAALEQGRPRLVVLGTADELTGPLAGDAVAVPMACASEGALAVHLEPVLPPPQVVVVGRSPAAATMAALARALGWRATLGDDSGYLSGLSVDARTAVVVATQGEDDEAALLSALATPAGYVGLVASRRRAATILAELAERGLEGDAPGPDLSRVRAPAGLDLGSVRPEEIAVAILAELVALRAVGGLAGAPDAGERGGPGGVVHSGGEALDPVCGMTVRPGTAPYRAEHDGTTWWFCGAGCQHRFEHDPAAFTGAR